MRKLKKYIYDAINCQFMQASIAPLMYLVKCFWLKGVEWLGK